MKGREREKERSQNNIIVGVYRYLWRPSSPALLKQVAQVASENLQKGKFHKLSRQRGPVLSHLHIKEAALYTSGISEFVSIASCSSTGHN